MAVILGIKLITIVQVSWGMNSWLLYGIARWLFYRGSFTMEVYVSSVRTRALGRYKAGGCCTGVTALYCTPNVVARMHAQK